MVVTIRQLAYFVALAEERSFVRAAERVHVSQPALSVQVRDLEAALAVQLVTRLPREIRLTRAGREVLLRARRVMAEIGDLEAAARRQDLLGRLHLGVIPTVAPYLLPVALPVLRATDLTRDLRVREAPTEMLLRAIEEGVLDAAVIASPAPTGIVTRALFEDRFLLAGSERRLATLAAAKNLRPTAIAPEQLLLLDEGHCLSDQALEACGIGRHEVRVDLGASSLATLARLVAEGFGLTLLPEIALRSEAAAAPGLRLTRFAAPEPARSLVLVRRAGGDDEPWFTELAGILARAGDEVIAEARAAIHAIK